MIIYLSAKDVRNGLARALRPGLCIGPDRKDGGMRWRMLRNKCDSCRDFWVVAMPGIYSLLYRLKKSYFYEGICLTSNEVTGLKVIDEPGVCPT